VYGAFDLVAEKAGDDPVKVWDKAMANVQPKIEVKSPRGWRDLPSSSRCAPGPGLGLGMRWLIHSRASDPTDAPCARSCRRVAGCSANKGAAVKKREDTHKMAEANKAFAHYRW